MVVGLTPDAVVGFIKVLSKQEFEEPVASIEEIDMNKLSSSLKTPFLRHYPTDDTHELLLRIAAHLFCIMIVSHYALNGNKRLAVVSLFAILSLKGYQLSTTDIQLYAIAMAVTWLSKYKLLESAIDEVYDFLNSGVLVEIKTRKISSDEKRIEKEFIGFMNSKS